MLRYRTMLSSCTSPPQMLVEFSGGRLAPITTAAVGHVRVLRSVVLDLPRSVAPLAQNALVPAPQLLPRVGWAHRLAALAAAAPIRKAADGAMRHGGITIHRPEPHSDAHGSVVFAERRCADVAPAPEALIECPPDTVRRISATATRDATGPLRGHHACLLDSGSQDVIRHVELLGGSLDGQVRISAERIERRRNRGLAPLAHRRAAGLCLRVRRNDLAGALPRDPVRGADLFQGMMLLEIQTHHRLAAFSIVGSRPLRMG